MALRVMIVGSGDIVHNLRAVDFRSGVTPDWSPRFNETAKRLILTRDHDPLIDWASLGPDADRRSRPQAEHPGHLQR